MFIKRETPPPGFVFPEEFALKTGLSTTTIIGLCNTGAITRLISADFALAVESDLVRPNYGVNGIIPESEIFELYQRCWIRGSESGLKPLVRERVCDFLCLPQNQSQLALLMAPWETEDRKPEEPGRDEYSTWELSLLYGVGAESWSNLMKKEVMRFRHLWAKPHFTRVCISGEVERLAKRSPEFLPKPLQKQLKEKGHIKLHTSKESVLSLRQQRKEPPLATLNFRGRTYREIPRSMYHLPLGQVLNAQGSG